MLSSKGRIYSSIGSALLILMTVVGCDQADKDALTAKPAYMISCGNVVAPEKMAAYIEASGPLFKAAGSEELAFGKLSDGGIKLLEGEWPYKGLVMIIRFPSMPVLTTFWNSPEYQTAMKLREGVVEPNFTIAIEKTR